MCINYNLFLCNNWPSYKVLTLYLIVNGQQTEIYIPHL